MLLEGGRFSILPLAELVVMSSEGALKLFYGKSLTNTSSINKHKIALLYSNTVGPGGGFFNIPQLSPLAPVARRRVYSDLIYTTEIHHHTIASTIVKNTSINMRFRTNATRSIRQLSTSSRPPTSGLRINPDRLWETIHETCKWGSAHPYGKYVQPTSPTNHSTSLTDPRSPRETGMARLCLTDDDARVRQWFATEVEKLGCSLSTDQMGNMFARQSGSLKSSAPMIAMGSHLDTQPRGGRYDGILGVVAAVEVLRTMKESGFRTHYDVGIVNWTKYVFSLLMGYGD